MFISQGCSDLANTLTWPLLILSDDTLSNKRRLQAVRGVADPGFTYDPSTNPVAAITTVSGEAKRIDRVLVRWAPYHDVSSDISC